MKLLKKIFKHFLIDIKIIQKHQMKCHKINLNHGASYTDSPASIKNNYATINPINIKEINVFNTL